MVSLGTESKVQSEEEESNTSHASIIGGIKSRVPDNMESKEILEGADTFVLQDTKVKAHLIDGLDSVLGFLLVACFLFFFFS